MTIIKVRPGDVAIFLDRTSRRAVDESGCNQWAIIVDEFGALVRRGRNVDRISLQELIALPNVQLIQNPHPEMGDRIASYFLSNRRHPSKFEAGEKALLCHNLQPFEWGHLFPSRPIYQSHAAFNDAWDKLLSAAKPMDIIFTRSNDSVVSRFVGWSTGGPFSNVAWYIGAGDISESVTSGMRTGKLVLTLPGKVVVVSCVAPFSTTVRGASGILIIVLIGNSVVRNISF